MQVKKRFTNTNIWEQKWFSDLTPSEKLLWFYINNRANNIGVWEPNLELASYHMGEPINQDEFVEKVNLKKERLIITGCEDWLLPDLSSSSIPSRSP